MNDLFDDDHIDIGILFDQLDKIDFGELAQKWPKNLADLLDVMCSELVRQGFEKEKAVVTAAKLAGVIGFYMGGRAMYIPQGQPLQAALREYLVYAKFNGRNIDELCREFKLSETTVYKIIREQIALSQRRRQHTLPLDE